MLKQSSELDGIFAALAHPVRRGIVERLIRAPASVSDLAAPLEMSLPSVVQHLKILEASGLIRSDKTGRVRTCRLEAGALSELRGWMEAQRAVWEARTDRLEEFLMQQERGDGDDGT